MSTGRPAALFLNMRHAATRTRHETNSLSFANSKVRVQRVLSVRNPLTDYSVQDMPGHQVPQVKCERLSDEEDASPPPYLHIPCTPQKNFIPLPFMKLEPNDEPAYCHDSVPTQLINLQTVEVLETMSPAAPSATPVPAQRPPGYREPALLQTLEPQCRTAGLKIDNNNLLRNEDSSEFVPFIIKDEPLSEGEQQHLSGEDTSDSCSMEMGAGKSTKSWTQKDMDNALEALRTQNMSLTKASLSFGIPSTTLWQRAHRLGIDTPKKEGGAKSWSSHTLRAALHALRAGALSANKASKAYGIPSSTLYKIARREGIRLSAPFNAAPTSWSASTLARALHDIRSGRASVQRAAQHYGIPTGTLYGRCKREGIELSRSNPTPWSEDAMGEALEAVRVGQMSINQAAIHYNLPYSSLYGRFKRCKYPPQTILTIPSTNAQETLEAEQSQHFYPHYPSNMHTQEVHLYPPQIPIVTEIDLHNPIVSQASEMYGETEMYYNQNGILSS